MSTAERQADDITAPRTGYILNATIAAAATLTVDLEAPAFNPEGSSHPHYWRDRYVTIMVETNDCQFAMSEAPGDVLTPGAAAGAIGLSTTRGAVIQAGKAPELRIEGPNSPWRYMQFASALGCTVSIWVSSPKLQMAHRHGFGDGGSGGGGGGGPVAMGGDVVGMSNASVVVGFGTHPIDLLAPALGDAWQWDGAKWAHVQQPVIFLVPTVPSTSIVSNRSADQSPTSPGLVGATNFGSASGAGVGVTADYATIIGGDDNEASETHAIAAGGVLLVAGAYASAAIGGESNSIAAGAESAATLGGNLNGVTASGLYASAVGGSSNSVSGPRSVVIGGQSNSATASHSAVVGGQRNVAGATFSCVFGIGGQSKIATQITHASGQTEAAGAGNRQWSRLVLRGDTPGAAPNETIDLGYATYGGAPGTTTLALEDGRAYTVRASVAAVRTAGAAGEGRSITAQAWVRRTGGVVNVVAQHLIASVGDPGCCLYDLDLVASGGNLIVRGATGAGNTHATRWVGSVEWEEVRYA